jgi:3-dehydroquinate synthase
MQHKKVRFHNSHVDYYFDSSARKLKQLADPRLSVILTDENVFAAHPKIFANWNTIVLKAGEQFKVQDTVDAVIEQMLEMGVDRQYTLVGVGGGVITDIAGYTAGIYKRGIRCGFVPSTLLALVDASIGGKNGVDVGAYKNMVGLIRQPAFILHDLSLLNSLPEAEWVNGFAEIIKHACIKDAGMFRQLEEKSTSSYRKQRKLLAALVQKNVMLKNRVVQKDEFETGERRHLNFGHTLGHALENQYELSHGQAISIGMTFASILSGQLSNFKNADRVVGLLENYGLPTFAQFDREKAMQVLSKDKKKENDTIHFVLLERIGKAVTKPVSIDHLSKALS